MNNYTPKDTQDAQYAMRLFPELIERINQLEAENKQLREKVSMLTALMF